MVGKAKRCTGALLTRVCLIRDKQKPSWEDVTLLQISKVKGPWTLPVKKIKADGTPKPTKKTIRLTAPGAYRTMFRADAGQQDSPTEVIKAGRQLRQQFQYQTFLVATGRSLGKVTLAPS